MSQPDTRTLSVGALARVEGEGALRVEVRDGELHHVELRIFEPPRFFEAFLRGRAYTEPPDITARICGICPVAYQMSACLALEDACGVRVEGPLRDLRRLLYCAEWIESHVLHVHLLHAPDFLGADSALELAEHHRAELERGLELKKIGNDLLALIGGRAVHPVNVRLGGFYRVPTRRELLGFRPSLERAHDLAVEVVDWVAGFDFPDFTNDHPLVALSTPDEYAVLGGRVVSSTGIDVAVQQVDQVIVEDHVAHSTALHGRLADGGQFLVGPMARYALGADRLRPVAREVAARAGLAPQERNPFRSIVVRAVEVVHAVDEALALVDAYEEPDVAAVPVPPRAGVGYGASEAPRGLLWHRYELGEDGAILDARIVPPTSQNQPTIEHDLGRLVVQNLALDDRELTRRCEQAIRNYDPCISCATHFLDVEVVEV
ncbi:MAG: nickel-dependent hydrogenase large subunit [Acidimicrobiales bacterium]|jgi:coenzyme F420-reducing hydrogenase alpha subunit|nr:nickel-dependent hydrogenase large subunit [Acidimicrobiales bacterium]